MNPEVSIAIPVYNGENYLSQAIESVLAQEFVDFELLISDNASTDQTRAICEKYASQDQRVRYIRHDLNRGATWNFNSIFEHAKGKYFCWLAHDDMHALEYLKQSVSILDENPGVVLCFSNVVIINETNGPIEDFPIRMRTDSKQVSKRFFDLLMVWHDCLPIFGLIRTDALKKTPLIGSYSSGDHVLLARLGLAGRFHILPENLFLSRRHPLQSNKKYNVWVDHHAYSRWFNGSRKRGLFLPQWELLRDYLLMINVLEIGLKESFLCYLAVGRWAIRYRRLLIKDWALNFQNLRKVEMVSE
jgi:glycosyltransferase involved in cell wall biosynthesis